MADGPGLVRRVERGRLGLWRAPLLMAPFFAAAWRLERGTRAFVPRLRLRIVTAGGTAEVSALVDSGNRLLEPFSGLPVLIVESDSLKRILGTALSAGAAPLPPGFRVVCYPGRIPGDAEALAPLCCAAEE